MTVMEGSGLFAAGVVLGSTSASLAVVEKRPKLVMGKGPLDRDAWTDHLVVVWIERFDGRLRDVADRLAARLNGSKLKDDCSSYLDVGELGLGGRGLLAAREAYPVPLLIEGDEEKRDDALGILRVPLRSLQEKATMVLEGDRLSVLRDLPSGAMITRGLERLDGLPIVGPTRDQVLATAIAVWAAERHATRGPWASMKPPPIRSGDWFRLREIDLVRAEEDRAMAAAQMEEEWFG